MKTALILAGFMCFSFSAKDKEGAVYGVWQGAYGMNEKIENAWVLFEPSNTVAFYEGEIKTENKMMGNYSLLGDTAISFTCKKSNGSKELTMVGNLNRTMNFVDGSWQSNDKKEGSFYLLKQANKTFKTNK